MADARMQTKFYGTTKNLKVEIKEDLRKKFLVVFYQRTESNESVFEVLLVMQPSCTQVNQQGSEKV